MEKTAVIFTGYSKKSNFINHLTLAKELFSRDYGVVIIDPFAEERKKWLFKKTLITNSPTDSIIDSVEKATSSTFVSSPTVAFFYSYGAIPGILQKGFSAEKNIFLSPALGKGTIRWSLFQRFLLKTTSFFPDLLPALKDMEDSSFQEKLLKKISYMELRGENIFLIPEDKKGRLLDERVHYSEKVLESLHGDIHNIRIRKHRDMLDNEKTVKKILDITRC
jgi:hypothetical protein